MFINWSPIRKLIWLKASGAIVPDLPWKTITGNPLSFIARTAHALKSCVVGIEPVQDLHGQANPYPPGGGKNKVDSGLFNVNNPPSGITLTLNSGTITANGSSSTEKTFSFYESTLPVGTYTFSCLRSGINVRVLKGYSYVLQNSGTFTVDDATQIYRIGLFFAANTEYTNATVSNIQIESGSSATDFAPYSNICPISGFTGANVTRTGINVWDEEWEEGNINSSGIPYSDANNIRSKNYCSIFPDTVYYINVPSQINMAFYDINKNFISMGYPQKGTRRTPNNAYYFKIGTRTYGNTYNNDISINYPSTDQDYHASNVSTVSVTWNTEAGTVYGGSLDVTTGVLTVTHKYVDLPASGWGKDGGGNYYYFDGSFQDSKRSSNLLYGNGINNMYAWNSNAQNNPPNTIRLTAAGNRIYIINPSNATTLTELQTALTATPLQTAYELAVPQTYQLTAQQVSAIVGENNMWTDCATLTVEAKAMD